ncbi:MAG: hypothetical protein ACIPMY_01410 [Rickettsia endosymbiont of Pentastiridius leporinus]
MLLGNFEKVQDAKLELLRQAVALGIYQAENNMFSEKSILDLIDDEGVLETRHCEQSQTAWQSRKIKKIL